MTQENRAGGQDLAARLETAERAARVAGALLLRHYGKRGLLAIEQKGLNDFVSNADKEAEEAISAIIRPAFPDDGFLGEETGLAGSSTADHVWCVDPLDGTTNFLKGAHNWCVSIGLWSGGVPVLGVIYDPLRDELFSGADGIPATCNSRPVRVSDTNALDRTALGVGHNQRVSPAAFAGDLETLVGTGAGFRQVGAGALMLAYVSDGRVDGYFERHMWAWDAVAGLAIIRAAGGVIHAYPAAGVDIARGDMVLASGPGLFDSLARTFRIG